MLPWRLYCSALCLVAVTTGPGLATAGWLLSDAVVWVAAEPAALSGRGTEPLQTGSGQAGVVRQLEGEPAAPAARTSPTELARQVTAAPEFWWKRSQRVESPRLSWSWLGLLYRSLVKPVLDLVVRALKAVARLLRYLPRLPMPFGNWQSGVPLLWIVAAAVMLWALWRLRPLLWQWLGGAGAGVEPGVRPQTEALPEAGRLLAQARGELAAGRYSPALRYAFLAMLAWLQDQGRLRYDPTRTNGEYRRDLARWPRLSAPFSQAAVLFDRVRYGGRPADALQAQRVIALCEQMQVEREGQR